MKYLKLLFTPAFMGIMLVLFALAMAVATFVENDFGSAAAYNFIYDTRWFELILLLLVVNMIGQIFEFKLYRKAKLTIMLFHLAFIIMIVGAGITRYFGYEGTIHIRAGAEENKCYSTAKYIGYTVKDQKGDVISSDFRKYSMTARSADNYRTSFTAGGEKYRLTLASIIPNAVESMVEAPGGAPVITLIVSNASGMENLVIKQGERKKAGVYSIGLESADSCDLNIKVDSGSFVMTSNVDMAISGMTSGAKVDYAKGSKLKLAEMQVISVGDFKLIPQRMSLSGVIQPLSPDGQERETGKNAFIFNITYGNKVESFTLWDNPEDFIAKETFPLNGMRVEFLYGSKITDLPFSIKLNDFILERYPGSSSPSGYKSDVVLVDNKAGTQKPYLIYMNNILKYKGYRFYQSSFDKDEHGTILSVNHDNAGMLVSYTGYLLLFLFIILSIINRKSVFHIISSGYWNSPFKKIATLVAVILFVSGLGPVSGQRLVPDKRIADEFGKVLVQDQKGRTKPMFTLSNDILRKVTRKNEFEGMNSMQVFLGLYLDFDHWRDVPLIRISNSDIQKKLGIRSDFAAFSDLVDLSKGATYKLSADVNNAYNKAPGDRNKFDKEVMKVDERLNIVYMIYTGEFFKIFPLKTDSHSWGNAEEAVKHSISREDSLYLISIIPMFNEAVHSNNISTAKQITHTVTDYQKKFSTYSLPSEIRTNTELFYYKSKIFERLFPFYATVGLVLLILLLVMVIKGTRGNTLFLRGLQWLLFVGFLFHTLGLGLRWYISGHSPMSNGYESMIFISWVTLLAGFVFSRKSPFALSATAVLGAMTLMVAHLSFMDPEITNLVPVLKSYWLTLHVSVITGSYGFLGLGAILGLINMILLALSNKNNQERIGNTIEELTVINYKTLTLGLYFLTIGTFLGAVWANESWGRYWGWDPKETWSLITVIAYSLVIHSRMIPSLKDIYSFNVLSLSAFSCVLMTYFGVNYYLSGMHSYASGDPVPVPSFVYITVILLAALSLYAYFKYTGWNKVAEKK
jgi:cytochrome c-type biogenesis protein CcsB